MQWNQKRNRLKRKNASEVKIQNVTKPGPAQVGAPLKFLKFSRMQWTQFLNFYFSVPKIHQRIRIRLGKIFALI